MNVTTNPFRPIAAPPRLRALIVDFLERAWTVLKEFGPYAAIELVLPGGSCVALLLWLYRRRQRLAKAVANTRIASASGQQIRQVSRAAA
jgi:hypothetical protein